MDTCPVKNKESLAGKSISALTCGESLPINEFTEHDCPHGSSLYSSMSEIQSPGIDHLNPEYRGFLSSPSLALDGRVPAGMIAWYTTKSGLRGSQVLRSFPDVGLAATLNLYYPDSQP